LVVLSDEECWSLVDGTPIGRVAFVHDGEPMVLPVNFLVDGHQIAFRSAAGSKFGIASMRRPVAFEVDGWDVHTRSGWSVLIEGMADLVLDEAEEARLEAFGLEPWAEHDQPMEWVKILPNDISGRRIPAKTR
jgi:nitroimidazol reductase NimA-like FMN-containing flavoprotein (pyridoxamine 5'-phosphate oxidase superfamily)